ncbi:hypothetical protein EDB19DRAFT_1028053 [Suillus lakei]|nr:hypothetical protein EDB19DRAFT_1028053 [Suillus lakei]
MSTMMVTSTLLKLESRILAWSLALVISTTSTLHTSHPLRLCASISGRTEPSVSVGGGSCWSSVGPHKVDRSAALLQVAKEE